jgi:hypothetical protein
MADDQFMALYKAGKFKEALAFVVGDDGKQKYTPSRYAIDKRVNKPIFYRGNKRVEKDENGEWQLAKHKFEFDD